MFVEQTDTNCGQKNANIFFLNQDVAGKLKGLGKL